MTGGTFLNNSNLWYNHIKNNYEKPCHLELLIWTSNRLFN